MAARVRWVLGDMRRLPATDTYQYGVLLDAFGFFEPDDENEEVIRQLRNVVVPGGRVVIAVVNGEKILNALEPVDRQTKDGRVVELRRELEGQILREEVVVREGTQEYTGERRQRLYSISEIEDIIARNGFRSRHLYGDMLGERFSKENSGKIVMFCERIADAYTTMQPSIGAH
jgi:hypothetical protein